MVKQALTLALAALLSSACRTTRSSPGDLTELPHARDPKSAIERAKLLKEPGHAAVMAWIEGNDRRYARERLDAGIAKTPSRVDLRVVRAALSIAELDDEGARQDLVDVVRMAPESAAGEMALVLLFDRLQPARDAEVLIPVLADVITSGSAERVRIATAIAARIARSTGDKVNAKKYVERGGFLQRWRGIGPVAPLDSRVLDDENAYESNSDWSNPALFRGARPIINTYGSRSRGRIPISGRGGLYVLETFVKLSEDANGSPLLFEAHLPVSGRVRMDGQTIVNHDITLRRQPSLVRVPLRANAGWHRVTLTMLAGQGTRPSLALLRADGKSVIAEQTSKLPDGAKVTLFPPAIGHVSVDIQDAPFAPALVDRWIADPDWTWFGRVMSSVVYLSGWYVDVDGALERLYGVETAAPQSAALHMARARMIQWSQLPPGMVQAAVTEALKFDADNGAALISLATAIRGDDPDRALILADRAAKVAPKSNRPASLRFRIYRQRGWNAEAVAVLRELAERNPSASLLMEGAGLLRRLDRIEEAQKLEARANALANRSEDDARTLLKRGDTDGALKKLETSNSATALSHAAAIELARGNIDAAKGYVERALAKSADHVPALEVRLRAAILRNDLPTIDATLVALRERGNATIRHEALRALAHSESIARPPKGSWLAKQLEVEFWSDVRYVQGTTMPKGLDPADPRSRYKSVKLLDRVVDVVRPDGQALSWRHEVTRLQTKEATDRAGEFQVPGDALPLTLRTLKPDGSARDVDRHGGKDDLSFSALAPGDAVELEWVDVGGGATPWGGYQRRFYFQGTTPIRRADYVVVVPKGTEVWTQSYNGAPEPIIHEEGDRQIYVFTASDIDAFEPEPNAVPHEEYLPFVVVAVDTDGDRSLAANTLGLTQLARSGWDVERAARELTVGIEDQHEQVHALYTWVTKNIGDGSSRVPSTTLATKRGDRVGLMTAFLRAVGIKAEIVLGRPGLAPQISPQYPSPSRFTARLIQIDLENHDRVWAVMTGREPWLGKLPPVMRGGAYVVASNPKRVQVFHEREIDTWTLRSNIELEVDPSGNASGHVTISLPGSYGAQLREFLLGSRKEAADRQLQGWLAALIPGARLVEFTTINAETPLEPFGLRVRVAIDHFMVRDGSHFVNESFFVQPLAMKSIGLPTLGSYLRTPSRITPMMLIETAEEMSVAIRFPAGTAAPVEAPQSFTQVLEFGQFTQAFEWDATRHEARLVRLDRVPQRRLPASSFPAFRESAQQILQTLRNRLIVGANRVETAALAD